MSRTRELPLFPLSAVLFPGGPLPLRIFEPRYVDMVGRCLREGSGFAVVLLTDGNEAGEAIEFAEVGTEARIVDFDRLDDGLLGLSCVGQQRIRVLEAWRQPDGLNMGRVEDLPQKAVAQRMGVSVAARNHRPCREARGAGADRTAAQPLSSRG